MSFVCRSKRMYTLIFSMWLLMYCQYKHQQRHVRVYSWARNLYTWMQLTSCHYDGGPTAPQVHVQARLAWLHVQSTVQFWSQVQSPVTSDPELNLYTKSSLAWVAHEHAAKQGTYLLSLNVILILMFCHLQQDCYVSCSWMPSLHNIHKQTAIFHGSNCHHLWAMNLSWTWKNSVTDHTPWSKW